MKVLLIDPSMFFTGIPPSHLNQALFYLYSYLRQHCPEADVEILNLAYELPLPRSLADVETLLADAEALIARAGFDVAGISCYTTMNYPSAVAVARICKRLNPEGTVVVGGWHPTAMPGDFDLPGRPFDFVVTGEGEEALRRIVAGELRPEAALQVVAGTNLPLEAHALRWEEVKYHHATELMFMSLSRGCPFTCLFCPDRQSGWRPLPPRLAVEEVRRVARELPQLRMIYFTDALFGVRKPWRDEFLALLRGARLPLAFGAESRVDIVDRDMIDALAALTMRVDLGLESAVPEMLAIMKKTGNPTRYVQTFREVSAYLNERQVPHVVNLILNYPGETNRTLDDAQAFWQEHYEAPGERYSFLAAHAFHLAPGSEVLDNWPRYVEQYGCWIRDPYWWRQPQWTEDVGAMVVASRELAESRQIGRPRELVHQLQVLSLSRLHRPAFEPFLIEPPAVSWANSALLAGSRAGYFRDKPLALTPRAVAHARVNGSYLLHHFGTDTYLNCSQDTTRALRELIGERRTVAELAARLDVYPDAAARRERLDGMVLDLVANDFLQVGLAPAAAAARPEDGRVVLATTIGEIELELSAGEAPELAANFLHLVQAGYYDSLQFLVPRPLDDVEVGAYTLRDDGPGYPLPLPASSPPFLRGAVAQVRVGAALHGGRIRIARSDRHAGSASQHAFGRVVRGLEVLDGLLGGHRVLAARVLAPAASRAR